MAAYEVLLLNTAIPQIQAAQSGDTYVVPRDIAFSTVANLANGTNLLPSLTFSSDTNTGIYREGADALGFTAGGGTNQMVLTSTGLGIGTNNPAYKLDVAGSGASTLFRINNATTGKAAMSFANNGTVAGAVALSGWWEGDSSNDLSLIAETGYGLRFYTNGSPIEKAVIDSSGNLGLGVTPNANWSTLTALQIKNAAFAGYANSTYMLANAYYDGSVFKYIAADAANRYQMAGGQHEWYTSTSTPVIGNDTVMVQAMTLDASGHQLVGHTSSVGTAYQPNVQVKGTTASSYGAFGVVSSNNEMLGFMGVWSNVENSLWISADPDNLRTSSSIVFSVDATERARITSGGYFKASNAGTYAGSTAAYHELYSNASGDWIGYFTQAAASNPNGLVIQYTAAAPNGTGNTFLYCNDNAAVRATIRSNGGLANYQSNNVDLSDARTKTDISPLASYWNKIAALEIVTYKYKDQTHDDLNIGVIAQQVEQVAPEFVDADGFGETPEDGVPLKTIYNKDLTFAAIKALQEAMARIETLEAEVAALKGA